MMDYRTICADILGRLNEMRLNETLCDMMLDVEGSIFHVHKVVLAATSKYFGALLQRDRTVDKIVLQGMNTKDMEVLLKFMYTGHLAVEGDMTSIHNIAQQLGVKLFKEKLKLAEALHSRKAALRSQKRVPIVRLDTPKEPRNFHSYCRDNNDLGQDGHEVLSPGEKKNGDEKCVEFKKESIGESPDMHQNDESASGTEIVDGEVGKEAKEITMDTTEHEDKADEHKNVSITTCPWCISTDNVAVYTCINDLLKHVRVAHPQCLYCCTKCQLGFLSKSLHTAHAMKCFLGPKQSGLYVCPECPEDQPTYSTSLKSVEEHVKDKHLSSLQTFHCESCSVAFSTSLELLEHHFTSHQTVELPEGLAIFECSDCNLRTLLWDKSKCCHCVTSSLGSSTTRPIKKYKREAAEKQSKCVCVFCGKVLQNRRSLPKHIANCHKQGAGVLNSISCSICDFTCKYEESLTFHLFRVHNIVDAATKVHKCPHCSYCHTKFSDLRKHIRYKHTQDKPFTCSHCSSSFKNRQHLDNHERIHTGEKPYQCDQCNYSARTQSTLQLHIRCKHSKKFHYFCACGYKGKTHDNMTYHRKRCTMTSYQIKSPSGASATDIDHIATNVVSNLEGEGELVLEVVPADDEEAGTLTQSQGTV